MPAKKRPNLVEASFLLCCSHKDGKLCKDTAESITSQFNNIKTIYAIRPYNDSTEDMCVAGTAIISPRKRAMFERDLKKTKIISKVRKRITKCTVLLHEAS